MRRPPGPPHAHLGVEQALAFVAPTPVLLRLVTRGIVDERVIHTPARDLMVATRRTDAEIVSGEEQRLTFLALPPVVLPIIEGTTPQPVVAGEATSGPAVSARPPVVWHMPPVS